jgi:hypothetical protein
MKSLTVKILFTSVLFTLPSLAHAEINHAEINNAKVKVPSQDIAEARALIKAFGGDLKHALTTAMKSGGPIKALTVCTVEAAPIAQKNSALSSWKIARTAIKVRNENNAPDAWEATVLRQFEERKTAGEDIKTMEYAEVIQEGEQLTYRYMKPIATAGLCLTCHGAQVDEAVTTKVRALYPNDQATGFTLGDIRGAFTLKKQLNKE